jgi:hypothetical protein
MDHQSLYLSLNIITEDLGAIHGCVQEKPGDNPTPRTMSLINHGQGDVGCDKDVRVGPVGTYQA